MSAPHIQSAPEMAWEQANLRYLDLHWERLRSMLARQVLWVRHRHQGLAAQGSHPDVIRDSAVDIWIEPVEPGDSWAFIAEDDHARALTGCIQEAESKIVDASTAMSRADRPPALELLAAQFGLNELERDILLLAAAPDVDPAFGRLYAYVQDDSSLLRPCARLAEELLCPRAEDRGAVERALVPDSPLSRYALVRIGEGRNDLRVDRRVLDYMRGQNRLDQNVAAVLTSLGFLPAAPSHREIADQLFDWLQGGGRRRWTPINLVGPSPEANLSLAVSFGRRAGLNLHRLDATRLPSASAERIEFVHVLAREAVLAQLLLYLEVPEPEGQERAAPLPVLHWVEHLPLFFLVASRTRLTTDRTLIVGHVPPAGVADREGLWREALAAAGINIAFSLDPIVEQFEFGPQQALVAAQSLRLRTVTQGSATARLEDLWETCREQSEGQLAGMARQIRPVYEWEDMVAPDDVVAQLREIAGQVAERSQVYQHWGFGKKLVRGRGISALFAGASGTGKTMAAEILAKALRLDLYRVELPSMVSKYIGETEKNLRRLFDAADRSGVILFFDEADALFGRRTEVKDSHDRFANIEINYLLQRMEEYNGLSILATNRKNDVDRAFLRRLRFLVDFPFPAAPQRLTIWRKVFPPETPLEEIDYETLSRLEVAGGNIRNIALSAAFLAAGEGKPVSMRHLLHSARREYGKMDKMIAEADFLRKRPGGPV